MIKHKYKQANLRHPYEGDVSFFSVNSMLDEVASAVVIHCIRFGTPRLEDLLVETEQAMHQYINEYPVGHLDQSLVLAALMMALERLEEEKAIFHPPQLELIALRECLDEARQKIDGGADND